MNADEIQKYRERLLREQTRLQHDLDATEESRQQVVNRPGEISHDPLHLADRDAEGLDREIVLESNLRDELDAVTQALVRTRDGTYGQCQRCGKDIGHARLDALPFAAFCIECEREVEAEEAT